MKVIVASMPKCGTKTLAACLRELGYSVHDVLDQMEHHQVEWERIFAGEGTTEDFQRMYENVDAVTDIPASGMWEEILKAFPDAKIIISERENEEVWLKSLYNQRRISYENWFTYIAQRISSTAYRFVKVLDDAVRSSSGVSLAPRASFPTPKVPRNDMLLKNWYRRHSAHVRQNAPEGQLLVFDLSKGWGPLCEFLGKPVPDVPFPHQNKGGVIFNTSLQNHPYYKRVRRNIFTAFAIWIGLFSYFGYRVYSHTFGESLIGQCLRFWADLVLKWVF